MAKAPGPHASELQKVALKAEDIITTAILRRDGDEFPLRIETYHGNQYWVGRVTGLTYAESRKLGFPRSRDFGEVVAKLREAIDGGELDPTTIKVKSSKSPVKGAALKQLCLLAWYEGLGLTPPTAQEITEQRKAERSAQQAKAAKTKLLRKELLAPLLADKPDVKAWNQRHDEAINAAPFSKVELAGKKLLGLKLVGMPDGDFSKCDLRRAMGFGSKLTGANFTGADLSAANLRRCRLSGAVLSGCDLSQAKLTDTVLSGAKLDGAKLDGAKLNGATFDAATIWPKGFQLPTSLIWEGEGPNPAKLKQLEAEKRKSGPVDLPTFHARLTKSVDKSRLDKAMKMLKKDSFQLFVDVESDSLCGVVKSQTDSTLVYSCRLAEDGRFACCTQNLNPCGGLRGALCKHLLVLIMGMANAGEVDADDLDSWVQKSKLSEPALDKDKMGAILLKYKGAEAGEIDWRPTETVPEDFYAY